MAMDSSARAADFWRVLTHNILVLFGFTAVVLGTACTNSGPTPSVGAIAVDAGRTGADVATADGDNPADQAAAEDATPTSEEVAPIDAAADATTTLDAAGDADPSDAADVQPDAQVAETMDALIDVAADGGSDAAAEIGPDTQPDVSACPVGKCDDKNGCTQDTCNPATGSCTNAAIAGCGGPSAPCTSSTECKGGVCDPNALACVGCLKDLDCGAKALCVAKTCAPAPACTSDAQCKATNQVCDKVVGVCADCVGNVDCAATQQCVGHKCVALPKPCQTSKDCPAICDKVKLVCVGCTADTDCAANQYCGADQQCAADVCSGFKCQGAGAAYACKPNGSGFVAAQLCSDGNPCTDDGCSAATGCTFINNTLTCNDNDACTSGDGCKDGKCGGPTKLVCDDKVTCTHDACDPVKGCVFTPQAVSCNDNNPCTSDGCDVVKGCTAAANTAGCEDGNLCTTGDACKDSKCQAGAAKTCQDGNECTTDACETKSGGCVFTPKPGCQPAFLSACLSKADCPTGVCNNTLHACVACNTSTDCAKGSVCQGNQCKPATGCTSDTQCKALGLICHPQLQVCVDCNTANACPADHSCVEFKCVATPSCKSSKDCPKVCDLGAGKCAECNIAADCPAGNYCNALHQCAVVVCKGPACAGSKNFACKTDGSGYDGGSACGDGNGCTSDSCEAGKGCVFTPAAGSCELAGSCEASCKAGSCVATPGPTLFDKTYGDGADEVSEAAAWLSDGTLLVAGTRKPADSSDQSGWLLRIDGKGTKLSDKTLAGIDGVYGLDGTGNDDLVACGASDNAGVVDPWVARIKIDGSIVWQATPQKTKNSDLFRQCRWIGGGIVAVGRVDNAGDDDLLVGRWNASGAQQWVKNYGTAAKHDRGNAIAPLGDGYLVAGRTNAKGAGDADAWLLKLDKNGELVWDKTIGGKDFDYIGDLRELAGGTFVAVGQRNTDSGSASQLWVMRLDGEAKPIWNTYESMPDNSYLWRVAPTADGGHVAVGQATQQGEAEEQLVALRVDGSGELLWSRMYGGDQEESPGAVFAHPDGTLTLVGDNRSKSAGAADAWVMRTDGWGNPTCASSGLCGAIAPAACDDGNACTLDSCDAKKGCVHQAMPGCCTKNSDCYDGEAKCTLDVCENLLCKHKFTGAVGCCNPNLVDTNFDDGSIAPFTASGSGLAKWQVSKVGGAYSEPFALWFGNPATGDFGNGNAPSVGSVSTTVKVGAGKTKLLFWLYQDTEISDKYDLFSVRVNGKSQFKPSTEAIFKAGQWGYWTADLSMYANTTITLEFHFDSVDSVNNNGGGIAIDDITVVGTCP